MTEIDYGRMNFDEDFNKLHCVCLKKGDIKPTEFFPAKHTYVCGAEGGTECVGSSSGVFYASLKPAVIAKCPKLLTIERVFLDLRTQNGSLSQAVADLKEEIRTIKAKERSAK